MKKPTIGVEEEFIVVDKNYQPTHYDFSVFNQSQYSKEMHQGVLETKTSVCYTLEELYEDLKYNRNNAVKLLKKQNLKLMACGTHPSADWMDISMVDDNSVYREVVEEYQAVAKSNYIFGCHIHIGLWNNNLLIPVMNKLIEYIPLFIALSSNSPFWRGKDSGLNSYRTQVFNKFPRTGLPNYYASIEDYFEEIEFLFNIGCLKKKTSIWQDIRIHPHYNTIEIRCFDNQTTIKELNYLAAFIYSLFYKIAMEIESGVEHDLLKKIIIEENKWKAARYGLDSEFITSMKGDKNQTMNIVKDIMFKSKDIYKELNIEILMNNYLLYLEKGLKQYRN